MKTQIIQTIYERGRYRVVPLVTLLAVEVDGRRLGLTYDIDEVDRAVMDVDELALRDGVRMEGAR
jgi:hypothetical protein